MSFQTLPRHSRMLSQKMRAAARRGLPTAALLGLAALPSLPAAAQTDGSAAYTFSTFSLGAPSGTLALGINDWGRIVGDYADTQGGIHGFTLDAARLRPGASQPTDYSSYTVDGSITALFGINSSGLTAGGYVDGQGHIQTFVLDGGRRFDLGVVAFYAPSLFDIGVNDFGLLSFTSVDASGVTHGAVGFPGGLQTVDDPDADPAYGGTQLYGNNDLGRVVGDYPLAPGLNKTQRRQAFLYDASSGRFTDLPLSAAHTDRSFLPYGINNEGTIVGRFVVYNGQSNPTQGFVETGRQRRTGAYTVVDVPGASATIIYGSDDFGDIVGSCFIAGGSYGFLGRPRHPQP